jgi:hypothetical protein
LQGKFGKSPGLVEAGVVPQVLHDAPGHSRRLPIRVRCQRFRPMAPYPYAAVDHG